MGRPLAPFRLWSGPRLGAQEKTLENKGVNNTLAVVAYCVASVLMFVGYFSTNGFVLPVMTERFLWSCLAVTFLNVLASWMAYRALDIAPLSFLMPFVALSSLGLVPVEYWLRDVLPNGPQFFGIIVVVLGAIVFSLRQVHRVPLRAVCYFAVTVFCYAFAPALSAIAVRESQSPLFSAALWHMGIMLGFIPLMVMSGEAKTVRALQRTGEFQKILVLMVLSGAVVALFENGPNTIAMDYANASEVMAVKRTMPFFALVLGIMMFKEKITRPHVLGTTLLVIGSSLIVWYR